MKPKKRSPIWPYLGILVCLFVLSVTAPRAWDRMARHESLARMLANRKAKARETSPAPQPLEAVDESEFTARETVDPAPPAIVEAPITPPVPEITLEVSQTVEVANRPNSAPD